MKTEKQLLAAERNQQQFREGEQINYEKGMGRIRFAVPGVDGGRTVDIYCTDVSGKRFRKHLHGN